MLRVVARLLGELAHEIIERGTQVVGELFDHFVAGSAFKRLLQRLLRCAQSLINIRDVAIFDRNSKCPHIVDGLAHRILGVGAPKLR